MRRNVVFAACLGLVIGITACQDQKNDPTGPTALSMSKAETQQRKFTRGATLRGLPAGVRISDLGDPAVVPTTCDDNTAINDYFLTRAFEIPLPTLILLINRWADLVPTYEALLFQTKDDASFFGYNGEYDQRMKKTERDVKRFW